MRFGSNVIQRFDTTVRDGSYLVERTGTPGTTVDGHYAPPAATTFFLTYPTSVQPVSGRALKDLPEGMRSEDVRMVFSTVELRVVQGNTDASDVVTIRGERYRAFKAAEHTVISDHWLTYVEKVPLP